MPAIEALAQRYGLWAKLRALPGLDPRVRTSHGYSPELIVRQLLYALCSGGVSLADAERLNDEPLARPLARVEHFADQTQLGEWRRKHTDSAIAAVGGLIRDFVQWLVGRAPASPNRQIFRQPRLATGWTGRVVSALQAPHCGGLHFHLRRSPKPAFFNQTPPPPNR